MDALGAAPLARVALLMLWGSGCGAEAPTLSGEGERCGSGARCHEGLACVADVGQEYGRSAEDDACEHPQTVYDFLHFGERGENRRVEEALAMLRGSYRLPRMLDSDPDLVVVPYTLTLADGTDIDCSVPDVSGSRTCLVPDWPGYFGSAVPKYSRFILFGLRMTGALVYVHQHASDARLRERVTALTGVTLGSSQLERLRQAARDLALALFDSFVERGHRAFALDRLPDCQMGSGYQNPNAAWALQLDQWDPTTSLNDGRLVRAPDAPVDCGAGTGVETTYVELRDSAWDRHATAYRALSLAGALPIFRGLLPRERRRAWLSALRDTGDALALPGSYEPGDNHGITQSVALMQLGHDLAGADDELLPPGLTDAWVDLGRHRLNDIVVDTVWPDGVQVEQSPFYHNYQLGLMLYVARWLQRTGLDLKHGIDRRYGTDPADIPPEQRRDFDVAAPAPANPDVTGLSPAPDLDVQVVIERMAYASAHLAQPDGWIPMIGSSLPQRLSGYNEPAFAPYLESSSRSAGQLAYVWSSGESGEPPATWDRLVVFEDSGFVTMHSAFPEQWQHRTHVVFNTGTPYHRHSHADALAVHLYGLTGAGSAAIPLLIDSGWYSYRDDARHYFESTSAHNTVTVDELNQCTRAPRGKRAAPHVDEPLAACAERARGTAGSSPVPGGSVTRGLTEQGTVEGVNWLYQSAAHALYEGVAHRRAVLLVGHAVLIVLDQLDGSQPHDFAQRWHVTPVAAKLSGDFAAEAGTHHVFFADQPGSSAAPLFSLHETGGGQQLVARSYDGEPAIDGVPGLGWVSTAEGQMSRHPVVEFRPPSGEQAAFGSVFLLGELAAQRAELALEQRDATSLRATIALPHATIRLDVARLASGAPLERCELQLEGRLPSSPLISKVSR